MSTEGFPIRRLENGISDYDFYRAEAARLRMRAKRALGLRLRRALRRKRAAALAVVRHVFTARRRPARPPAAPLHPFAPRVSLDGT